MTEGNILPKTARSAGDVAVDGLLRGVAAGLLMACVLVGSGLLAQLSVPSVLSRFDPTNSGSMVTGLLAHLATSGVYGVVFALIIAPAAPRLGSHIVLAGLLYAALLLLVSRLVMASDLGAPLRTLPAAGWALSHLVYGGALGALMVRK